MNRREMTETLHDTASVRDSRFYCIHNAATTSIVGVLGALHTSSKGLDEESVVLSRSRNGSNRITRGKRKSLPRRLAEAFINPFSIILFCLALISAATDVVFPYFSLLGGRPDDIDPLSVIISGALRFIDKSRSGKAADIILLEKDLIVLEQGIIEGRKTYANMIKYIKMTASSNFGNMFSVLAASALLPFLPMTSIQLILLNLINDLSCTAIPWGQC